MLKKSIFILMLALGMVAQAAQAAESNPLDKALSALAKKFRTAQQSSGTTATANMVYWMKAAQSGNSATASAASNSASAQAAKPVVQEKLEDRMKWAKGLFSFIVLGKKSTVLSMLNSAQSNSTTANSLATAAPASNTILARSWGQPLPGSINAPVFPGAAANVPSAANAGQGFSTTVTASAPLVLPGALTATAKGDEWVPMPDAMVLTATATAETITVSWSNSLTARREFKSFKLYKGELGKTVSFLGNTLQAATSFQDCTVTAGIQYVYQVVACDLWGQTMCASYPVMSQLLPSLPPAAPQEAFADSDDERVLVRWKEVPKGSHAIAGYKVYRMPPGGQAWECLNNTPVARTDFGDDHCLIGKTYNYQVVAVDTWGLTSPASTTLTAYARPRSRNGMVLMSTAYRGSSRQDTGFTGDMQFTYFIGTLYGVQDKTLSPLPLYLDPISLWMLTADIKYTGVTEEQFPAALALGGKSTVALFAGQQKSSTGSLTFSQQTQFNFEWGTYLTASKTLGNFGLHGGYLFGNEGNSVYYLSKYLLGDEPVSTRQMLYAGMDFPIVRRMNTAWEILYPLDEHLTSRGHPFLVNLHVDRLFNFDVAYLHWDQGWAFLGYFNLRFTLYPGSWK